MPMNAILSPSTMSVAARSGHARPWVLRAMPVIVLVLLALLPWCLPLLGLDYYLGFVRRVLIVVLGVAALDLLVGTGGLVALGHASFIGVGAYAVAAGLTAGITSAWMLGLMAAGAAATFAAFIGSVALRTRGVYFIMITLAFGQMLYYLAVTLRIYGGDDGYTLTRRPSLGLGLSLDDEGSFYWLVLIVLAIAWWLLQRVADSPLGHVLRAARDNEARTSALGYPVFRARLVAFVLAGALAGVAGALMLTHNGFVSPASMHWSSSAILLVMLVLGGTGRYWGPAIGVAVWMVAEEALRQWTDHWHGPLGALLIGMAVLAPRGMASIADRMARRRQQVAAGDAQ